MKKLLLTLAVALCLVGTASAQQGAMAVGGGLNLGLPLGDFADGAGFGFGFKGRFQYGLTDQVALAASLGYISFAEKNSVSQSALPILVSGRFYFMPGGGVYGQADLGLTSVSASVSVFGFSVSSSTTNFSLGFGGGYETKIADRLYLDAGAGYNIVLASGGSISYINFKAGVNYAL